MAELSEKEAGWKSFLQNTSFHGVRYIAPGSKDDTANKSAQAGNGLRRVVWLLFVIAAISLFVYQVADRAKAYFRHETNINVELVYVEKLDFPAVTICNQNTFRLTKAVDRGVYNVVSDVFSPMSPKDIKFKHLNFSEMDPDEFMFDSAHSRYDFIDRCTWNNSECNITRDFTTRMTDFGVCYTFNADPGDMLPVRQSGASFGLSLLLNIEQYEYMKGPQNDAGVKILLHDQREEPLIKDLGFAVAPGSHTLVGVKISKVESLEPPWGKCASKAEPHQSCEASCTEQALRNHCCTHVLSATTNDTKQLQTSSCDCDIPCQQTVYEPSMSYAQLSKYTAEQVILRDPEKRADLLTKLLNASETAQRNVRELVEYNNIKYKAVLGSIQRYQSALDDIVEAETNFDLDGEAVNLPVLLESALSTDEDTIETRIMDKENGIFYTKFDLRDWGFTSWVREIEDRVLDVVVADWGTHDVVEYRLLTSIEKCINNTDRPPENITIEECKEQVWTTSDSRQWKDSIKRAASFLGRTSHMLGLVDYHEKHYDELVQLHYGPRLIEDRSLFEQSRHQRCLDSLGVFNASTHGFIRGLETLTGTTGISKALEAANLIKDNVGQNYNHQLFKASLEPCQWMYDTLFSDAWEDYVDAARAWKGPFVVISQQFETILTTTKNLYQNFESYPTAAAQNIHKYQNLNLSFYDLSAAMTNKDVVANMDGYTELQEDLNSLVTLMIHYLTDVFEPQLLKMYTYNLNTTVPMFYDETIQNFELVQMAMQWNQTAEIQYALTILMTDPTTAVQLIIRSLISVYQDQIKTLTKTLQRISGDVSLAMNDLQNYLADYLEQTQVNEKFFMDNFLQVDIFYKQLSYEKVTQQRAFEFLSLLSEVGGFMGLLLGASVLTVCELVDHMVVSAKRSCKANQGKASAKDEE